MLRCDYRSKPPRRAGGVRGEDGVLAREAHAISAEIACAWEDYADDRDGRYALPFKDQILGLIKRFDLPEEAERGLMQWYGEDDSVNKKVLSAHATVEEVDGELMGVMVCRVKDELTADERGLLDEFVIGQMADGLGESLEQREIKTDDGEIYVSFWNSGNDWKLSTAEELRGLQSQNLGMEMSM